MSSDECCTDFPRRKSIHAYGGPLVLSCYKDSYSPQAAANTDSAYPQIPRAGDMDKKIVGWVGGKREIRNVKFPLRCA